MEGGREETHKKANEQPALPLSEFRIHTGYAGKHLF